MNNIDNYINKLFDDEYYNDIKVFLYLFRKMKLIILIHYLYKIVF